MFSFFNFFLFFIKTFMKRYAIVTFMFDNYDLLREPTVVDENLDYYCLTDDKNLKSNVWECIYIPKLDTNTLTGVQKTNIIKNSFYKYLPKQYDWWICIDASIRCIGNVSEVIDYLDKNHYDVGFSIHATTTRFMEEYGIWEQIRGLNPKYAEKFKEYARVNDIDLEQRSGMIECTVKIYKNDEFVLQLIDEIYDTLEKWCNFEDNNDQPYITSVFSFYDDELKTCFFYRQLYYNSKYFEKYMHGCNFREYNEFTEATNNRYLLGKIRKLKSF